MLAVFHASSLQAPGATPVPRLMQFNELWATYVDSKGNKGCNCGCLGCSLLQGLARML